MNQLGECRKTYRGVEGRKDISNSSQPSSLRFDGIFLALNLLLALLTPISPARTQIDHPRLVHGGHEGKQDDANIIPLFAGEEPRRGH